jgi:hypothetical protein
MAIYPTHAACYPSQPPFFGHVDEYIVNSTQLVVVQVSPSA